MISRARRFVLTGMALAVAVGFEAVQSVHAAAGPEKFQQLAQPDDPPEGRPERGPRGGGKGEAKNVEGAMKGMGRAMKQLRNTIADAGQKEANLKLIGEMERNCIAAKEMAVPENLMKKAKDDDAKSKLKMTFRSDLMTLLHKLLDLEQSVIDGKGDAAKAQLEEIQKLRDSSHKDLGVKEEKRGPRRGPPPQG